MEAASNAHEECFCHYQPHLIAVPIGRLDEAINASGGRPFSKGEACQILDGLDDEIVGEVLENIGIVWVDAEDPHEIAAGLNPDIEASPVHGVGYLGHGGFQGSAWQEVTDVEIPDPGEGGDQIIAVIDSGIAPDEDLPDWMRPPSVLSERPIDIESLTHKDPVGHGTFVTSVIRRVAPEARVSIASARPDPGYLVTNDPEHKAAPPPTDELNLLGAMLRLLRRHRDDEELVRALNLSLGAHACPADEFQLFLTFRKATQLWTDRFGEEAPVFAAAGNSLCPQPLYPAAFSLDGHFQGLVHGVAAAREGADRGGEMKVWDDGTEVDAPHRDWVTDAAPGCEVLGLSGQSPHHVVEWGGSSHATAVASAGHLIGLSSDSDLGIEWWPDREVRYTNVPNLVP